MTSLLEQVVTGEAPDIQRLSAAQYHQIREAGILLEGAPVELIDGLLVQKNRGDSGDAAIAHGRKHAHSVRQFQRLAAKLEPFGCCLQTQLPLAVSEMHEPEPDAALLRGSADQYRDRLPVPSDVLVVIEVADSSLEYDRTTKLGVYAQAQIPVYWIVNLRDRTIEQHEEPDSVVGKYGRRCDNRIGDVVHLSWGKDTSIEIAVAEIMP